MWFLNKFNVYIFYFESIRNVTKIMDNYQITTGSWQNSFHNLPLAWLQTIYPFDTVGPLFKTYNKNKQWLIVFTWYSPGAKIQPAPLS